MPTQHPVQVLAGNSKSRRGLRLRHWRLAFAVLVLCCHSDGQRDRHWQNYTDMWDSSTSFSIFLLPVFSIRFWRAESEWQND